MRSYNCEYQNEIQFFDYLKKTAINPDSRNILVQVFTSIANRQEITMVCEQIKKYLPWAQIIGTTTSGEILEHNLTENTTILSISVFDETTIKTVIVKCPANNGDEYQTGVEAANQLNLKNAKVIIMFSDGIHTNSDEILKGIESINNQILVAGGRAADNGNMKETLIFNDREIINCGVVGAVLVNPELYVYNFYSLCWSPIGKQMTVSKAKGDVIYEIDNTMVRDVYEKYLGDEIANNLPKGATEFALLTKRNNMEIARVAFGENVDEGVKFIGNVYQDEKVFFSHGNYEKLIKRSQEIIGEILKNPVESMFIYSCAAKKVFFQEKICEELAPFSQIANCVGFFTYGEFFHSGKKNVTLNLTTTILVLAEYKTHKQLKMPKKERRKIDNFIANKQNIIVNALTHLANKVTQELNDMNKDLICKNDDYKKLLKEYNRQNVELVNSNKKLREQQNSFIRMEKFLSLGQFMGGIAHNLQTPLMSSSGGVLKLQQDCQRLQAFLEEIASDKKETFQPILNDMIKWQSNIKNYLLYMSEVIRTVKEQVQNNKEEYFFTVVELMDKIKLLLEPEIVRRNSSLWISVDVVKELHLKGDINNLIQVFSNVIINAVESYDGKGGEVRVTAKIQGKNLEFYVEDQGKGISPKISRKVFTEMITTKGKNGTGLGLYISYLIIKTHFYGDIYFQNNTNRGTIFIILLPYYSPERSCEIIQ
jgi:signal transduction histidine kinase